jgi:hypothetical protein
VDKFPLNRAGPNDLAGFKEAPVNASPINVRIKIRSPIMSPAKTYRSGLYVITRIDNTRNQVRTASNITASQGAVLVREPIVAPKLVSGPRKYPTKAVATMEARNWTIQYAIITSRDKYPVEVNAKLTIGLKWAPL